MTTIIPLFVLFTTTLLCCAPVHGFSLRSLSEQELRGYALKTSKGCITNKALDDAGPVELCSMTIDYIREIMRRKGWAYQRYYQ